MNHKTQVKQAHRLEILRLLFGGGMTRADLARKTGLSRAAVTLLVDELLAEGMIRERERMPSVGGNSGVRLGHHPSAYRILGLDVCRDGVHMVVTDFRLGILEHHFFPKDVKREDVIEAVIAKVKASGDAPRWLGVGISVPGPIDAQGQRVINPTGMEAWHGFAAEELAARLSLPVLLQKDTDALAVAEKLLVYPNGNSLVLLADHGIGGAMVYRGRCFSGGCELGHVSIDPSGERCSCGNRGCAELYASVPATLKKAREIDPTVDWNALCRRAAEGDSAMRQVLEAEGDALGELLVSAVNLLEPDRIVLEGMLSEAWSICAPRVQARLRTCAFTTHGRHVRVLPSSLPAQARSIGAVALVMDSYLMGELL